MYWFTSRRFVRRVTIDLFLDSRLTLLVTCSSVILALSDPECDSDLLLKCSSPEEEDDLLGEIQCKQDIEDIGQIQERAGDQGQSTQETQKEQELTLQTKQQEREQDTKERNKTPDPLKTLRPPMSVSCRFYC